MTAREAFALAAKYDARLRAGDPRFGQCVHLVHDDGSSMFFDSAFLIQHDIWLFLFTEHHSYRVYGSEEILHYAVFRQVHRPLPRFRRGTGS